MKYIVNKLMFFGAALMLVAVPVLAEERAGGAARGLAEQGVKDECLLVAMNDCAYQSGSIQKRIDRLQNDISKGAAVYTKDELNTLQNKLDDENKLFDEITTYGGG